MRLFLMLIGAFSFANAVEQRDFYGVWVRKEGSVYYRIAKESITRYWFAQNNKGNQEIDKYRIVKWEKPGKKSKTYIVHALNEDDEKKEFRLGINEKSNLITSFPHSREKEWESKRFSVDEFNKILKEVDVALDAKAREAIEKNAGADKSRFVIVNGIFIDYRDGRRYKTVKIGSQTWMAENLNYKVNGSKCYANRLENCAKYGVLYSWNAAVKACPSGWRLPANEDWDKLYVYADGTGSAKRPYDELMPELYLKAKSGWKRNTNGRDVYGFTALPGGYGSVRSSFDLLGNNGYWWSALEKSPDSAYGKIMDSKYFVAYGDKSWGVFDKLRLHSVRCLRD